MINSSDPYRVKLQKHFRHSLRGWNLQLDLELVGGEVEGRGDLAALQVDREQEVTGLPGTVGVLVSQQVEVLTHEIQTLVRLQGKPLGPER